MDDKRVVNVREEIYTGTLGLDSHVSEEEQRNKIIQMMENDGIEVPPIDEIEIGYVGADDNDGLSETQTSKFVVYRVKKENEIEIDENLSNEEVAQDLYNELKELKEEVNNVTNSDQIMELMGRIDRVDRVLNILGNRKSRDYDDFNEIIAALDFDISELEKEVTNSIQEYEASYERIKNLMSEEGANDKSLERSEELEKAQAIRDRISELSKKLTDVKRKKKSTIRDLEIAKALGISSREYQEIVEDLDKKEIINSILEAKGLGNIITIPSEERTPDERKLIRDAREEILKELAGERRKDENKPLLDLIEALYGISPEVKLDGKQRVLIVKNDTLNNIHSNSSKLPEKIVKEDKKINYVPGKAPEDMVDVMNSNKNDDLVTIDDEEVIKISDDKVSIEEVFTFYTDIKNQNNVYVRKYAFERFNIDPINDKGVRINGELCFRIDEDDLKYISENADNSYSPYTVKYESVEIDKENELKEQFTFFVDLDDSEKVYARKYVFERFNVEKAFDEEVRINGELCWPISIENVKRIANNNKNSESSYSVKFDSVDFDKGKKNVMVSDEPVSDYLDKFVIFIDKNTEKLYVRKNVFDRFNIDKIGLPATVEGALCFEVSRADADYIINNANNNYSPYIVEFKKTKADVIDKDHDLYNNYSDRGLMDKYTLFRDIETNKIYVRKPVFDRFNATSIGDEVKIKGVAGYEISEEDARYIQSNANNNYSPYVVDIVNLRINNKNKDNENTEEKEDKKNDESYDKVYNTEEKRNGDLEDKVDNPYEKRDGDSEGKVDSPYEKRDGDSEGKVDNPYEKRDGDSEGKVDSPYEKRDGDSEGKVDSPYEKRDGDSEGKVNNTETKSRELTDKFTIFRDSHSNRLFVRRNVLQRFNLDAVSPEVKINGASCFEISLDDANFIRNNADNNYSPYVVNNVDLPLGLNNEVEKHDENKESKEDKLNSENTEAVSRDLKDKFTIFRDSHSNRLFVRRNVLQRFNLDAVSPEVKINGASCFEISLDDANFIRNNANNSYSPYAVNNVDLPLGLDSNNSINENDDSNRNDVDNSDNKSDDVNLQNEENRGLTDKFTIFRDSHSNRLFVRKNVLQRFNLSDQTPEIKINGASCFEISEEDANYIKNNANNSYSPYIVEEVSLPIGLKSKKSNNKDYNDNNDNNDNNNNNDNSNNYVIYRDSQSNRIFAPKEIFDRFNIEPDTFKVVINGNPYYEINEDDLNYLVNNANNKYSPYEINVVDLPIGLNNNDTNTNSNSNNNKDNGNDKNKKYTIYRDSKSKRIFAPLDIFNRFNIIPDSFEVVIDGVPHYEIVEDDLLCIEDKANNTYSPYKVEVVELPLGLDEKKDNVEEEEVLDVEDINKFLIYKDADTGKYYVSKALLDRFRLNGNGDVEIDGKTYSEISKDDVDFIVRNANNNYSPYQVTIEDIHLNNSKDNNNDNNNDNNSNGGSSSEVEQLEEDNIDNEDIVLYRDSNDNGQVYASDKVLRRFGIEPEGRGFTINGERVQKISKDTDQIINNIAKMSRNPKMDVSYREVRLNKKEEDKNDGKSALSDIVDKLTDGIEITEKDRKHYKASRIKVSDTFKNELKSGKVAYNIIHIVPATVKAGINFLKKLGSKLIISRRAKEISAIIRGRMDKLSPEELKILTTEYKSRRATLNDKANNSSDEIDEMMADSEEDSDDNVDVSVRSR